jgi:integrase
VAFRQIPNYITKGRAGYVLQRGVPKDVRSIIGKANFKESGGKTLQEARARVASFIERTDREIAIARGGLKLSPAEEIERLTYEPDPEVADMYLTGAEIDPILTPKEKARVAAIVTGEASPVAFYGASDLLSVAVKLKAPAARTEASWRQEMKLFMEHCHKASPLSCTKEDAVNYRSYLLGRVSANTAKTRMAYLAGLWSVLEEEKPGTIHIFKGLIKRIKVDKPEKIITINDIANWQGSVYIPVFQCLYYTGCRIAEIAGLRGEDILVDRIVIQPHEDRPLKTKASERHIPIHTLLEPVVGAYRGAEGLIWPKLKGDGIRWGHNLSKPCRTVTGTNPHGLRHRAATKLREANFNEATIGRLLGHTPNTVTGGYGSVPWERLVEAVEAL